MKGAKPALQPRSKKTRDRLVAALERLLKTQAFEQITVAQIAAEAGVSVGAVYTRFENKDAFIPVLLELYRKRIETHREEQIEAAEHASDESLRGVLRRTLTTAARMIDQEGHLLRAVHLYARVRPDLIGPDWDAFVEEARESARTLVAAYADEITHPDPDLAAETLTYFLNSALIEAGLYPDLGPPAPDLSLEALADELADYAWGYLTAPRGA